MNYIRGHTQRAALANAVTAISARAFDYDIGVESRHEWAAFVMAIQSGGGIAVQGYPTESLIVGAGQPAEPKKSVLETAQGLINGPRAASYGSASIGWSRAAKLWSIILGTPITAKQALLMMILLKVSREVGKPDMDNIVDIAGYAGVIEKLLEETPASAQGQAQVNSPHEDQFIKGSKQT